MSLFKKTFKSLLVASCCMALALGSQAEVANALSSQVQFKFPTSGSFAINNPFPGLEIFMEGPDSGIALTPDLGIVAWDEALRLMSTADSEHVLNPTNRWVLAMNDSEAEGFDLSDLLSEAPWPVTEVEVVREGVWKLKQNSSWETVENAAFFAEMPMVRASYPICQDEFIQSRDDYAALPNDPLFVSNQWNLDHRNFQRELSPGGLNVRSAWPIVRGGGVKIGIGDEGIEMNHPDLKDRTDDRLSFNFVTNQPNGNPTSIIHDHGTAVAGLAAATADNDIGVAGVAPEADLVSLMIVDNNGYYAESDVLAEMFQYETRNIQIQNHSWGPTTFELAGPTLLEDLAITEATENGRIGKGVVMIRAAGNSRSDSFNVNQDGYSNRPDTIAVAATRKDGRVASYSTAGAALLVAAPGGDFNGDDIATTDRQGFIGINNSSGTSGNYLTSGFVGTSGSAPQVAGLVALMLSARPDLGYRDVQQILALSSRIVDQEDPENSFNGAGLQVSHNVGYGIPDAGLAVSLSREWNIRENYREVSLNNNNGAAIPDAGLVVEVRRSGGGLLVGVPQNIVARSTDGLFPPHESSWIAVEDIGLGGSFGFPVPNLIGKAALIQRGILLFSEKIDTAERFGAELAIIFDNLDQDRLVDISGADRAKIPAVFISKSDGEALKAASEAYPDLEVRIRVNTLETTWNFPQSLSCEHVGVKIRTNHQRRGDLRLELISPAGTVSVLQSKNFDDNQGPLEWTYYSTRHFFENSQGTWRLRVLDEMLDNTGFQFEAALIVRGVPFSDDDRDGLPDSWEQTFLGGKSFTAGADPDFDGKSNLLEWLTGSDPMVAPSGAKISIAPFEEGFYRLSWPGRNGALYQIDRSQAPLGPFSQPEEIPGVYPVTEWVVPALDDGFRWFRIMDNG